MADHKSVRFNDNVRRYTYEKNDPILSDSRSDTLRRHFCETRMVKKPRNIMDQIQNIFTQCRQRPITIVFGNLGRQPQLLTYYLDLIFTSSDKIGITSQWPTDSPYHVKYPPSVRLDVLMLLEPHFGYTVTKPPNVDHVLVFSSHLCLLSPEEDHTFILHLSPNHPLAIPSKRPHYFDTWTPPVFYDTFSKVPQANHVHLDVTSAKSVHEAYLRLLTGRELLPNRKYSVETNEADREILHNQLKRSKRNVLRRRWSNNFPDLEAWYWKDFETPKSSPHYIILKRNPLRIK